MDKRRVLLFSLTFVVAFCSIVYELIYSELLTVIFGGTVVRYSITIGLFLFSFGIGSFLFNRLSDKPRNFLKVEISLSLAGPLGLIYIILLNTLIGGQVALVFSHLPIIVVGVLSGLEVPYLTSMVDEEESDRQGFSEVLGMDYIGSLFGTIVYALILYPSLGLVPSIFVLGLLNSLAASTFSFSPDLKKQGEKGLSVLMVASLVLTAVYGGVLVYNEEVEKTLTNTYLESQMESEYPSGKIETEIIDHKTTRYQDIVLYERRWTGDPKDWIGRTKEKCLRLDLALQLCESWVDSYHSGLVDVPATFYRNLSNRKVLLIGGGDWIAINHLRKYNVSIDHVDIDREFMEYTKDHPFFEKYHNNSYRYDRLETKVTDAYSYVRGTKEKYDLILLDVPGIRNDDLLKLYSTEFFRGAKRSLTEDGILATWGYTEYVFPEHHKTYINTVKKAGFEEYIQYDGYDDFGDRNETYRGELFYVFSDGEDTPLPKLEKSRSPYIQKYKERYIESLRWKKIPTFDGIKPNSVFDPNYKIIIDF